MKRLWLLLVSIVLCFVACDMPATGGNPGEGSLCKGVTKNHANKYYFDLTLKCRYRGKCDVKLFFDAGYYRDSLSSRCFSDYELDFVTTETSKKVLSAKEYNVPLESDDHLRFSLIDINNVEKKYDIDLSGIINSYTVRGDSVEVKSFECLNRMVIYRYRVAKNNGPHDIIDLYPDSLRNGKYVFYQDNLLFDEIYFNCSFGVQSSFKTDSVYIHGDLYWR